MSNINYVSNVWGRCANVHMKQLGSHYKRCEITDAESICSLQAKVQCSQITPARQTRFVQQMCSDAKGCSRRSFTIPKSLRLRDLMPPLRTSQYLRLRDLMLPSGRLYSVQGHKQLIPRKGIDFLKASLSFSGSHPLTTVMNLKTFGKKVFQQLKESIPTIP